MNENRLIDYLERGADEPLRTDNENSVIRSAERVNTFKEIKRLPMRKPVGKYNLHNKISKSEGTSH